MYIRYLFYFSLIFIVGCAAYKELQPVPQISFLENGYIEIKDDDEQFELSEGDKYFMKIPPPADENIYLILSFDDKASLNTYLTRAFDDGEGEIIKMTDISVEPGTSSVYELDRTVPSFFWVIEEVKKDMVLNLEYRYIAAWRYKFETKHAEYVDRLKQNTQSRNVFNAIGTSVSAIDVDYSGELASIKEKNGNLTDIQNQLHEIEAIFPADILNSQDPSYLEYLQLKKDLSDELEFQENYSQLLDLMSIVTVSKA